MTLSCFSSEYKVAQHFTRFTFHDFQGKGNAKSVPYDSVFLVIFISNNV